MPGIDFTHKPVNAHLPLLDHLLDAIDGVGGLHTQGDGRLSLHEDLPRTTPGHAENAEEEESDGWGRSAHKRKG